MNFLTSKKKVYLISLFTVFASICIASAIGNYKYDLTTPVNRFTNKLYRVVTIANPSENVIMSPFSVHSLLSMLTLGTRSHTEIELLKALGYRDITYLTESYRNVLPLLKTINGAVINMASKIYAAYDLKLNSQFLISAQEVFSASASNIDFNDNKAASATINGWVETQTNNKITDLIPPSVIDPNTKMVLVNAIYFKGLWKKPFDPKRTLDVKFTTITGSEEDIQMMYQEDKFLYGSFPDLRAQVVELYYEQQDVSMVIVLPDDANNFSNVEKTLSTKNIFSDLLNEMSFEKIYLGVPKFKIELTLDLTESLPHVGITSIFNSNADLSGLLKNVRNLAVTDAIHKAFIEVDEFGTTAAAATAVVVGVTATRYPVFICDRPFIFYIIEKQLGKILFVGKKVV
uniref:Serine protease inhibitor n=1 Tax=Hydropsyche angustipennis TaxID=329908 RepID=H7CEG0_9NEOP|nr:serine protease inhibitor [Hydropsyche angustipennis]BAL72194.1 serine proteinase inhibitor [Hydropsyche angustipennis]